MMCHCITATRDKRNINFKTGILSRCRHSYLYLSYHITIMLFLVALISAASLAECSVLSYPLHASCEIRFGFSESCDSVKSKIVAQINAWDVSMMRESYNSARQSVSSDRGVPNDESRLLKAALWADVSLQADGERGDERDGDPHHPGTEICGRSLLHLL